jgi:hypothetical protein
VNLRVADCDGHAASKIIPQRGATALEMLNRSPRSGRTNTLLLAHGFALSMLIGLIRDGLAEVRTEIVTAPGRRTEIVRFRITAAGRRAIRG